MFIIIILLLAALAVNFLPVRLGVKVLGATSIAVGLWGLFLFFTSVLAGEVSSGNLWTVVVVAALAVGFSLSGIALLKFKRGAPKIFLLTAISLFLFVCAFFTALSLPHGPGTYFMYFSFYGAIGFFLFLLPLLIYFSRASVKAQFQLPPH